MSTPYPSDPRLRRAYGVPEFAGHDPLDPDHPGNSRPGGDQDIHTAYWAFSMGTDNHVVWMWNCEACPAVGTEGGPDGERHAVRAMNAHVADTHPDDAYAPTAEPS